MKTTTSERAPIKWSAEDRKRHKEIREQFAHWHPTLEELIATGEYSRPVLHGVLLALWQYLGTLKEAREVAGLTLEDVARKSGIGKAALSRLERGQQINPTINTLGRYAAALGKALVLDVADLAVAKQESHDQLKEKVKKRA